MKRLGAFLIVIGIGSLILPRLGMQFRLMSSLESSQPAAGIVVAGIGVLFIVLGSINWRSKPTAAMPPQFPQQAPPVYPPAYQNIPAPPQATAWPGTAQVGNCARCSQPLWAGDIVCRTCGLPVNVGVPQPVAYSAPQQMAQRCPNPRCGQTIPPGKKFCTACGTRLF